MPNKRVVISECEECTFFDYEYYTYNQTCRKLGKRIESERSDNVWSSFPIPEDCPLEDTEEPTTFSTLEELKT